jgi:hypothetical protein
MTEHEQLVERVAEVIWSTCTRYNDSGDEATWGGSWDEWDDDRAECVKQARAAISTIAEALREPTDRMVRAGWEVEELVTPDRTWSAMLSASPLNGEQKCK